jgi:hypothetical protein
VDQLVDRLYLQSFDRAPVDHIRTLVETDAQIRDAIVSVRYGKSSFLDDRTRNRLYLAGIVGAALASELTIKNRVIDAALSEKWLGQIEGVRKALLASAERSFFEKDYESALRKYEESVSVTGEELGLSNRIELAISRYFVGEVGKALQELLECERLASGTEVCQTIRFYVGAALVARQSYSEALEYFRLAAEGKDRTISLQARLSAVVAHLQAGARENLETALDISNEIISELSSANDPRDLGLLTQARFNQSRIFVYLDDLSAARQSLSHALPIARDELQPTILLAQYDLSFDHREQRDLIEQIAHKIIDSKLAIENAGFSTLDLSKEKLAKILVRLKMHGLHQLHDSLLDYAVQKGSSRGDNAFSTLLSLFESLISEEDRRENIDLLVRAATRYASGFATPAQKASVYRWLAMYARSSTQYDWLASYLSTLESLNPPESIDDQDLLAFAKLILRWNRAGERAQLKKLFAGYERFEAHAAAINPLVNLIVLFHKLDFVTGSSNKDAAKELASRVLSILDNDVDGLFMREIPALVPQVRIRAGSIIGTKLATDPFGKFRRNQIIQVRYGEGPAVSKKFKHVEGDLRGGKCKVID